MSSILRGESPVRLSNSAGISASFLGPTGCGFFSGGGVNFLCAGGAMGWLRCGGGRRSNGLRGGVPDRLLSKCRTRVSVKVGTGGGTIGGRTGGAAGGVGGSVRGGTFSGGRGGVAAAGAGCSGRGCAGGSTGLPATGGVGTFSIGDTEGGWSGADSAALAAGAEVMGGTVLSRGDTGVSDGGGASGAMLA